MTKTRPIYRAEVSHRLSRAVQREVESGPSMPAMAPASLGDLEAPLTASVNSPGAGIGRKPGVREKSADWLLWQLADSALPTGGFAHSAGLEAAWQHGEVKNRGEIASLIEASLRQLGHGALPFVTAAHRDPQSLSGLDSLCDAFTSNHVANRASRAQGRALLAASERIFATPVLRPPCGHYAPVFGAVTALLDVSRDTASRLFFFSHLRALTASAVRLGIVGPMEAQTLQHRLAPRAQSLLAECESLTVADLAQTSPPLDLWQGAQDRLYSRLFQS